ncbi:hypothetical protein CTheo_4188 [Ceratobasidium theobromae]|uniref:Uncharacterized protein n=1 Tax=Ceratobasidium theobromae TaxID=1582974 RepID=A0A5N5QL29_9AGAM|nr:hypothetical protein CTheo_4188 [Ceratobasidium theobromae]
MPGRKKRIVKSEGSSQSSIANWLASGSNPTMGHSTGAVNRETQASRMRLVADSNPVRLKHTIFSGSSSLSSAPSEPSTPLRRSSRIRASATPAPIPAPSFAGRPTRVLMPQTPPRMPPGIKAPSPLRDKPRRSSPPCFWTADDYCDPSDTDEVPSSQKDDAEPAEEDIETLESIPIFHMSSPPTSLSSEEPPTPAITTPPLPLSPDSKARHIVAEIRAKARTTASFNSPPLKRSHSPLDDSDSDALPDADFFFGNKEPPSKRRASTTPSPQQQRRLAGKSKPKSPKITTAKPKPAHNPFAAIRRERALREKREESDGSYQGVIAAADAALLRDPDATFDEGCSQDAIAALDQLAESGFAAEAELVRKARITRGNSFWGAFGNGGEAASDLLVRFPQDIGPLLNTKKAKRIWNWIEERMNVQDYATVEHILDTNLVQIAFSDPQEHTVLDLDIQLTYFPVALSPSSSLPLSASRQALLLIQRLANSEAQDRVAIHVARSALRAGPPGDGVHIGHSILNSMQCEPNETSFVAPGRTQTCSRIWLCANLLKGLNRTKQIFPVLGVLCLLGLDPALDVMTRFDIAETAELWACKAETTEAQLDICSQLVNAFSELPIQQKRDMVLKVLRGTRPVGVVLCMWLATAFLDGEGMKDVNVRTYRSPPPLERIIEYAHTLHITPDTNYPDLLAAAQLLDIALWDVAALVEGERGEGRIVKYQPGVPVNSMVMDVIDKLAELHGRILDARAADLERTRTKAYLQTLQVRLGWDLIEAARSGQKKAKTIKEIWGKPKQVVV